MPSANGGIGILSLLTFLPLLGALVLLFMPAERVKDIRIFTLIVSVLTFGVSLGVLQKFNGSTFHFQLVESIPWIPNLGISYKLGVDGISIWLILLTTLLMVLSVAFSWYVDKRVKQYMAFLLLLETTMLGVFLSLDLVLFYTFFEASLIPMYFLINIWGGERRSYAAVKFFIYTFAGSIFMLVGIIALSQIYRQQFGSPSFDLVAIQSAIAGGKFWTGFLQWQAWIFWAFAISFMVKCPMFPFHTWLPDAHVEAPTAGSVILAGVLLKMGTYGFLRFCLPLFPEAVKTQIVPIVALAVIGIIYGAVVAAIQPDIKKLVAYSSVAHMGFVMLGIFSLTHTGMVGGALQQLNHGISTGALFLLIGLIYERLHTRQFKDFGGLKAQMPIYSALFLVIMLSSVGLPGTNGFVGEFLAMLGAFESAYAGAFGLNIAYSVVAGFGVVLAAVYLLIMFQRAFYGPNENPINQRLKDLKPWEIAVVSVFILFVFWGGLYPNTFIKPMEASIGATRLMALAPEGSRPDWANADHDIDAKGNLVRHTIVGDQQPEIIQPAELHYKSSQGAIAQR